MNVIDLTLNWQLFSDVGRPRSFVNVMSTNSTLDPERRRHSYLIYYPAACLFVSAVVAHISYITALNVQTQGNDQMCVSRNGVNGEEVIRCLLV